MRIPWNALTLVLALATTGLAERHWVAAQSDAAVVLAVTLEAPFLGQVTTALTDEPREVDALIAGVPALVVQPGGEAPWPAVVFVNGATRNGRHHPTIRRLAHGLARAGFVAVVPDPPALPASLRSQIRRLSPLVRARRIRARVELASAPMDK